MNNKKKELIILGIVTLVLLVTLGVTYAIFTLHFLKQVENQNLLQEISI